MPHSSPEKLEKIVSQWESSSRGYGAVIGCCHGNKPVLHSSRQSTDNTALLGDAGTNIFSELFNTIIFTSQKYFYLKKILKNFNKNWVRKRVWEPLEYVKLHEKYLLLCGWKIFGELWSVPLSGHDRAELPGSSLPPLSPRDQAALQQHLGQVEPATLQGYTTTNYLSTFYLQTVTQNIYPRWKHQQTHVGGAFKKPTR